MIRLERRLKEELYQIIDPVSFLSTAVSSPKHLLVRRGLIQLIEHCKYGGPECWESIVRAIRAGADANSWSKFGITALQLVVAYQAPPSVVRTLIDAGATVDARDRFGNTPLMMAADQVNHASDYLDLLIKAGANVNQANNDGWTALMFTVYGRRDPDVVRILLRAGANVKLQNKHGDTALAILKKRIVEDQRRSHSFAQGGIESIEIDKEEVIGDIADVTGTIRYKDDSVESINQKMIKEDGDWRLQ